MIVDDVSRIDGEQLGPLLVSEVLPDKLRLRNSKILERIVGQPTLLAAESAEGPQGPKRETLTTGIVAGGFQLAEPVVDQVIRQLFDDLQLEMIEDGFQMPPVQIVRA